MVRSEDKGSQVAFQSLGFLVVPLKARKLPSTEGWLHRTTRKSAMGGMLCFYWGLKC